MVAEEKKINHLALIMDGNSRWAKSKGLPTKFGHKKGSDKVIEACDYCIELGIKHLSIYAFSTENWKRPKEEVDYLMDLVRKYFKDDIKGLHNKGINVKIVGSKEGVPDDIVNISREVEKLTEKNEKLYLNILFNYGGRKEIVDTTKTIAKKVKEGLIDVEDIDENIFANHLYNSSMPDVDLVLRTGGAERISNLLPWQISYSEFYFIEKFWPAFTKKDLIEAVENFKNRERRYGGRKRKKY